MRGTQTDTYKLVNKLKEEEIGDNVTVSGKLDLEVQNDFKTLTLTYWLSKRHKTPVEERFIVASIKCSTKALLKTVTKAT